VIVPVPAAAEAGRAGPGFERRLLRLSGNSVNQYRAWPRQSRNFKWRCFVIVPVPEAAQGWRALGRGNFAGFVFEWELQSITAGPKEYWNGANVIAPVPRAVGEVACAGQDFERCSRLSRKRSNQYPASPKKFELVPRDRLSACAAGQYLAGFRFEWGTCVSRTRPFEAYAA
jgi:hypothetical protein